MSSAKALNLFEEIDISDQAFEIFAEYLYKVSGIYLINEKKNFTLFSYRLKKLMRSHGISDYEELSQLIKNNRITEDLKTDFINSLTTNKTHFFREEIHFQKLPKLVEEFKNKSNIYIWCAASSTGQEPYSIQLNLLENCSMDINSKLKILATDIDTSVLKTATEGIYTMDQLAGLSEFQINKYFENIHTIYSLKNTYRDKIHFSQLNLFNFPFPISKKFDIIFCRNVLIYFKQEDRLKICTNLTEYLNPGGYLVLGLSESASIKLNNLEYINDAIYRKIK